MKAMKNVSEKEMMYRLQNRIIIAALIVIPLLAGAALIVYPKYLAPVETDASAAMSKVNSEGAGVLYFSSGDDELCYWITPTFDSGYFLEIRKYNSTSGDCYGKMIGKDMVGLDGPVSISGDTDCICSKRVSIAKVEQDGADFLEVKIL